MEESKRERLFSSVFDALETWYTKLYPTMSVVPLGNLEPRIVRDLNKIAHKNRPVNITLRGRENDRGRSYLIIENEIEGEVRVFEAILPHAP